MISQKRFRTTAIALITAAVSHVAFAVEAPDTQPTGEFYFGEVEGRKASPNRFMIEHNLRLAYPADVDSVVLGQAAAAAWSQFGKMKFHGAGNGQSGVWRTVGPVHEQTQEAFGWHSTSGRVTGLAIGPECNDDKCRIFVATAGGGVWRSNKGLHPDNPGWQHLSNGLISNNIGYIGLDPNDATGNTVYVGSGEGNFNFTSIAGLGVFRSFDGGDSFRKLPTVITDLDVSPDPIDFTLTRGIEAIAIKPGSPDTIYVGTTTASQGMTSIRGGQSTITGGPQAKVGIYKTTDGGASWSLEYEAPVNTFSSSGTHEGIFEVVSGIKDIRIDPLDADTVWASVADLGIVRSAPALEGGDDSFKQVFEIVGFDKTDSYAAFELVVKDGKTRAYVYNGNGSQLGAQALYRLDDAGVPALSLYNAGNQAQWVNKTTLSTPADYADFVLCGVQCVYDLVVASPPGLPDTVFVAGNFSNWTFDAAVYSTDGGENFKGFGVDVGEVPASPHVDTRAIAFSPENPDIVFIGSDGGVVRSNGNYADATGFCGVDRFFPGSFADSICKATWDRVPEQFVFMNRGLQTMQLYNISADPNGPLKRIMAGTQDNSTQWSDGTQSLKNWTQILDIGDGTSANGFHRDDPNILFASWQSANFLTNFTAMPGRDRWYWTAGPINFSGETLYANEPPGSGRQFITFDPSDADTQYTGYERIWRTSNNGGDLSDLQANGCRLDQAYFKPECGDWEPLGDFLTRDGFGLDRAGGIISTAERSSGDTGTLWAGTTLGRVFITGNADAPAAGVSFIRLDTPATPDRFVSGIAVDGDNPNRAFVTYSGFSAVTPATPGHVFEVVYDPNAGTASFTSIDYNLGDLPVNHVVRDDPTGDLYIATDFGVLMLASDASEWTLAGEGFPAALTPHLEIHPSERKLFAATHGLGGWYMNLPRLKKN